MNDLSLFDDGVGSRVINYQVSPRPADRVVCRVDNEVQIRVTVDLPR